MDDFVRKMHTKSGLIPAIEASTAHPRRRRRAGARVHARPRARSRHRADVRQLDRRRPPLPRPQLPELDRLPALPQHRRVELQGAVPALVPRGVQAAGPASRRRTARSPTSTSRSPSCATTASAMLRAAGRPTPRSGQASSRSRERAEERGHRPLARRVAHEADAPRLPGELAEAAADLDAVGLEQRLAQRGVVGAVGQPRGGELAGAGGRRATTSRNPSSGSAAWRRVADGAVAGPRGLEALVEHARRARRAARRPSRPARCGGTRAPRRRRSSR